MLNLISFVIINCLIFVSLIDFLVIFVTNAWPWSGDKKKILIKKKSLTIVRVWSFLKI